MHGADINQPISSTGWTPLMIASYCRNYSLVKLLLRFHPSVEIKDRTGKTVLDIVKEKFSANDILQLLTEYIGLEN